MGIGDASPFLENTENIEVNSIQFHNKDCFIESYKKILTIRKLNRLKQRHRMVNFNGINNIKGAGLIVVKVAIRLPSTLFKYNEFPHLIQFLLTL